MPDAIPTPYHRWRANEDAETVACGPRDFCLDCGTQRNPLEHLVNEVKLAEGPCPAHDPRIAEAARLKADEEFEDCWDPDKGLDVDARRYRWWLKHYAVNPDRIEFDATIRAKKAQTGV
jgi:hypothetical protein